MNTPDQRPALVDVIVVTWNSAHHVHGALDCLPEFSRAIVVDNGSRDTSVRIALEHRATVIEAAHNVGFAAAVNLALPYVTAATTLLLNPDVVLGPDCLQRCLDTLWSNETIALVGPATRTSDGRPEPAAARHDRRAWHVLIESLGLVHIDRRFDRQMVHDRRSDRDVDAVNGAFMLLRTSLLRDLGGLDESVFMYLEDMDLCRRVRDAGFRVRFVADASAVHEGGASTARGDDAEQARAYLHRIDADLEFLRRYGRKGEAGLALAAYVLRSLLGIVVGTVRPRRRTRYRAALAYTVAQRRGRQPPPPV